MVNSSQQDFVLPALSLLSKPLSVVHIPLGAFVPFPLRNVTLQKHPPIQVPTLTVRVPYTVSSVEEASRSRIYGWAEPFHKK